MWTNSVVLHCCNFDSNIFICALICVKQSELVVLLSFLAVLNSSISFWLRCRTLVCVLLCLLHNSLNINAKRWCSIFGNILWQNAFGIAIQTPQKNERNDNVPHRWKCQFNSTILSLKFNETKSKTCFKIHRITFTIYIYSTCASRLLSQRLPIHKIDACS